MRPSLTAPVGTGELRGSVVRWLPAIVAAGFAAAATVVCAAGYVLPRHGVRLGAPSPPFYGFLDPVLTWWTPVSVAAIVLLALAAPRLLTVSARTFCLLSALIALTARAVLNIARHGPNELVRPLTGRIGRNDPLASLHLFTEHPIGFLGSFAGRVADLRLPVQVMGHPPGSTVLLGALRAVDLGGAWPAAALILVVGSLAAPLVYLVARQLVDERAARIAALAWVFAPSVLLLGATSFDAVYATAGIGTALLMLRGRASVAAAATVACSFLSYALLGAAAWVVLLLLVQRRRKRALRVVAGALIGTVLFYGILLLATGYDPVSALRATSYAYRHGVAGRRPGWYWPAGDLVAFFVALGVPVALAFALELGSRSTLAAVGMLVLVVAAVGGFSKAEVERIWLFAVPFVTIAAAPRLRRVDTGLLLLGLAAQAIATEICFGTTW
jgi:hypothetical protein